jgi:hypothetical protein
MAMLPFQRFRLRRAAKRYARRLGPQLQRSYGAATFYTVTQLFAAMAKQRLDPDFVVIACAMFLDKEAFDEFAPKMPVQLPYEVARALYIRAAPRVLTSASGNVEVSLTSS